MSTTTISKNSENNPYNIVHKHLKIQAVVDLIQDYIGYHQDLYYSLRLRMPKLIPELALSKPVFERQVVKSPCGFSAPYVLFEGTIFSMTSGNYRPIPPYPLARLKEGSITPNAQLKDGVLLLQAYGPLAANEAQSALNFSFYRIEDLSLICTLTRPSDTSGHLPKCTLQSRNVCVLREYRGMAGWGYSFLNPQNGEFTMPSCVIGTTSDYDFCLLNDVGAIYTQTEHWGSRQTFFAYGRYVVPLVMLGGRYCPAALIGPHLRPSHPPFTSYDIATGREGVLENEMGICDSDLLLVDHNWLLFSNHGEGGYTLSLKELRRKRIENSSSSSSSASNVKKEGT